MKTYIITYDNGFTTEIEANNIAEACFTAVMALKMEVISVKRKEM